MASRSFQTGLPPSARAVGGRHYRRHLLGIVYMVYMCQDSHGTRTVTDRWRTHTQGSQEFARTTVIP